MARNDKSKSKEKKSKKKDKTPWYSEGLRFECTQCGACCSGEPGYVWVNEDEIEAMADEIGLEVDAFERKFVRQVEQDKSLIEYPDGDCIMLDPRTRKVHGLCLTSDSMSDMAVLGFNSEETQGLERDLRGLSRCWYGTTCTRSDEIETARTAKSV